MVKRSLWYLCYKLLHLFDRLA